MDPITTDACTLPTAERPLRRAEFDTLFAEALLGVGRDGEAVLLSLAGGPGLLARVRDLAEREAACCSFFTFTATGTDAEVALRIEVEPRHRDILEALTARAVRVVEGS